MIYQNISSFSIKWLQRTDIAFALAIVMIISVMIMPVPRMVMDFFLALSITFSVLILMTSLFIERPLDFSSFPTILLVSTMIRLSLNIASTRLILTNGHEGPDAAGKVIEAFGEFVMGGNFVIGLIVFAILIIVNFVVITKGSSRIAEVSARFSLDAMPGKQMSIDADLSSGLISEDEAKNRRKNLEAESTFFGAMDGSSKFVRGDAIAGLLITFINIVGGIIIGVLQKKMPIIEALKSYTLLTVGDGLVSQMPALIVSTAAGLLVSKAGVEGPADKAIFTQLGAFPKALGISSLLIGFLGLLPGVPLIPFLILALLSGFLAWTLEKQQLTLHKDKTTKETQHLQEKEDSKPKIGIDLIRIDLGHALIQLLDQERPLNLRSQIRFLRQQLHKDMGIILPSIHLQDNVNLPPHAYVIFVKELEAGRGELFTNKLLVIDCKGPPFSIEGIPTKEPTFGLSALWIEENQKTLAESKSLTVVNPCIVLTTHLCEIVKNNIVDLLTYADVQNLLDALPPPYKKLLNDMVPAQINITGIQRILQNLVSECISIRDLATILEGIFEASGFSRNLTILSETVRQRLSRQISHAYVDKTNTLSFISLSSMWEENFLNALQGEGDNRYLALSPSLCQEFIQKIQSTYAPFFERGENPPLIVLPLIRPFVRMVLERSRPSTIVLSQNEIVPKIRLHHLLSL